MTWWKNILCSLVFEDTSLTFSLTRTQLSEAITKLLDFQELNLPDLLLNKQLSWHFESNWKTYARLGLLYVVLNKSADVMSLAAPVANNVLILRQLNGAGLDSFQHNSTLQKNNRLIVLCLILQSHCGFSESHWEKAMNQNQKNVWPRSILIMKPSELFF